MRANTGAARAVNAAYTIEGDGSSPVVAAAIHDGHELRPEVAAAMALSEKERLREEDPFTARFTAPFATRIIGQRSRFEVDLNRTRDQAVYRRPDDAWGLHVWREPPPDAMLRESLAIHDAFRADVQRALDRVRRRWPRFVVLDLHSYNHRRNGPDAPPADPEEHPEVNVGTSDMDRQRWAPVVDAFVDGMREVDYFGRRLDVRENVCFRGGAFSRWVHRTFPDAGCALAIEFRKFFMDEWSGEADELQLQAITSALASTTDALVHALERVR